MMSSVVLGMIVAIKQGAVTHPQSWLNVNGKLLIVNAMAVCGGYILWLLGMAVLHHYIVFTIKSISCNMLLGTVIAIKQAAAHSQGWLDVSRNCSVVDAIVVCVVDTLFGS